MNSNNIKRSPLKSSEKQLDPVKATTPVLAVGDMPLDPALGGRRQAAAIFEMVESHPPVSVVIPASGG